MISATRASLGFALAVALAFALAAVPATASAAGAWLPTQALATSGGPSGSAVALDGVGDLLAAWNTSPTPDMVRGAQHTAGGGGFTALASPLSTDAAHDNTGATVASNRAGAGIVAWTNNHSPGNYQVQFRAFSPGGVVGSAQTVPLPADTGSGTYANIAIALNENGDAVIAWRHGTTVEAITRHGAGGAFTNVATPAPLGTLGSGGPNVAIDAAGNAVVTWANAGNLLIARHAPGGSWPGSPDQLTAPGGHAYTTPWLASNPAGAALLAFLDTAGVNNTIQEVSGSVSGGFGSATPTSLSQTTTTTFQGPLATVLDNGGALVAWSRSTNVEVSKRPANGAFPAPAGVEEVAPVPVAPNSLTLAGDGPGDAILAWYSFETPPGQNVVRAAVKLAGTPNFGASTQVPEPAGLAGDGAASPTATMDQRGDAALVWDVNTGATPIAVALAPFDTGPVLGAPSIPATAAPGQSVAFSIPAPMDAFSGTSTSWSFGDGSPAAAGNSVAHTFATPGTFTVRATVTDTAGLSAVASASITVAAGGGTTGGGGGGTGGATRHCVVPKLAHKTLTQAKRALSAARCRLGKVHRPKARKHHKLGKLVVIRSSPRAGAVRAVGTKVNLTLGPAPKPKPKPKRHKK